MRRARRLAVIGILALALVGLAAVVIGPPLGLFSGARPADLGPRDGRLRPGDGRPNWVSSQVSPSDTKHHIDAIAFTGDAGRAWEALLAAILAEPGASVVTRLPEGYLHVEFASRMLRFIDDGEFLLDANAGVIQVRSGARLGVRDFSVNRERVERLRASLRQDAPARR